MKDNGAICPLLWTHHCVVVSNDVTPCCRVDHQKAKQDGSYWKDTKISEGIFSENHKKVRQDMREGIRNKICSVCYDLEERGVVSGRLSALKNCKKDINYNNEPTHVDTIDIKFNNLCNLACRMCNPGSSSLVNKLTKEIGKDNAFSNYKYKDFPENYFLENEKLDIIKHHIQNGATEFKTTGGEPFYQPHFRELIDWCIENNYHKNLNLKITSNLIAPSSELIDKMSLFNSCEIFISMDGYGKVYEYIRYPANWEKLVKNIKRIKDNTNIKIQFNCVLQIYNLFNLVDLKNFADQFNTYLSVDVWLKPMDKNELCVRWLPHHLVNEAIQEIDIPTVNRYLQSIDTTAEGNVQMLKEFVRKTIIYDKQRNQDYRVLDPRIVALIDRYK